MAVMVLGGHVAESGRCTKFGLAIALFFAGALSLAAAEVSFRVSGADRKLDDALRAASLSLGLPQTSTALARVSAARADYARLIGVLYEAGYYAPVIRIRIDGREAAALPPFDAPKQVRSVDILVEKGPRFHFALAQIGPLPGTELPPERFRQGKIARSGAIKQAAHEGLEHWRARGYAKARIATQRITANHPTRRISARIQLDPGPRLRFGLLRPSGTTRVRPERIRAIADLPRGARFSPEVLERAATRLRRTGVFRSVTLSEAAQPGPDNTLDIDAVLIDQKRRRYGFGAEVSSLEGLGLSALWMHRNLLGGAERLRIEGEVSGIGSTNDGEDYQLTARFDRPATFSSDTALYLQAMLSERDEPDYSESALRAEGGISHIFSDHLSTEAGLALRVSQVDDDLGARDFTHLMFPLHLLWQDRDSTVDPMRGSYLEATLTPFAGFDDSRSGLRLVLDARHYHSLSPRLTLAGRVQVGSVLGAGARYVPPDLLFFSGGGGSVRGQPYQSLAIERGADVRIGGAAHLGLSLEARMKLRGRFGLVAFTDFGAIGQEAWIGRGSESHGGAGLGLRYDTGLGPLRVDLAAPIHGDTGDGMQLYVGIGQAF